MEEEEEKRGGDETTTYCVTGASGYIGSWLVKTLLQTGFTVHATFRDLSKSMHFVPTWTGRDRLKMFRADLEEEGSFDEAVNGCDGVFHVAASMEFNVPEQDDKDSYVQKGILDPAVKGTLNLMRSCLKSKSVKRVVFTSSISTLTARDGNGRWRSVVDESCTTPIDQVWSTKASGWVYVLSKLMSEEAAFGFAKENGIDLVSVITTTVAGPFLTPTVPSSIQVLMSPITDSKLFSILSAVNKRMGSIGLVHIQDICNAHIFLMDNPKAEGQYICCVDSCVVSDLINVLVKEHQFSITQMMKDQEQNGNLSNLPMISSKKLRDLGFEYEHRVEEIIRQTVNACKDFGYL